MLTRFIGIIDINRKSRNHNSIANYPQIIEANLTGSPELKPTIKTAVSINFFDKNVPNIGKFAQFLTAMSTLFFDVFFHAYLVCGYLQNLDHVLFL